MNQKTNLQTTFTIAEPVYSSKFSEILNTCDQSKNLMISIYLIDKNQFLFCNKVFEKIIGYRPGKLFEEGWDFWLSRINTKESNTIENKIFNFFSTPLDEGLLTLCYHFNNFYEECIYLKHEILLCQLGRERIALNYFFDVSEKEIIEQCIKFNNGCEDFCAPKKLVIKISSREKEVLQLIADGFSSKQIAEQLYISNHTAISHRKHLIEKFNVRNTAHLIKEASKVIQL